MAVTISVYPSASLPTTDSGVSGGNINTGGGTESETTPGALVPALVTPSSGNPDGGPYYYADCAKNVGATDFVLPVFYIKNGLTKPASGGPFTVTPDSADATGKVRLLFLNGAVWDYEDLTLVCLYPQTTAKSGDANTHVLAFSLNDGDAITAATVNYWISRGSTLGMIPTGRYTAQSNIRGGIDLTVNSTLSAASRITAPVGITFGQYYTASGGVYIPGPVNLAAGQFIKFWYEITLPNGSAASAATGGLSLIQQPVLAWSGT